MNAGIEREREKKHRFCDNNFSWLISTRYCIRFNEQNYLYSIRILSLISKHSSSGKFASSYAQTSLFNSSFFRPSVLPSVLHYWARFLSLSCFLSCFLFVVCSHRFVASFAHVALSSISFDIDCQL